MNKIRLGLIHQYIFLLVSIGSVASISYGQTQEIEIETELSRSSVYIGDEIIYQVIVRGIESPPRPDIDFPAGLQISYNGRSTQSFTTMRVINGRRQSVTDNRISFQYTITPLDHGNFIIPEPRFNYQNQLYIGKPREFNSLLPIESESDELILTTQDTSLYVNELLEVECTWWIGDQTSDFSFSTSQFSDQFKIYPSEPPNGGQQHVRVDLNGVQLQGTVMPGVKDGNESTKLVFRFGLLSQTNGEYHLGPFRVLFTRHEGTGRSYRAYTQSESVLLTVSNPPLEDRPPRYSGTIGNLDVSTEVSNTQVNVGDPIQLTMTIAAPRPILEQIEPPDLRQDPAFSESFKVATDGWRETQSRKGTRSYQTTIRATDEHVRMIPQISISSFLPSSMEYTKFSSNPIPITVNAVTEVTLADAVIQGDSYQSRPLVMPEQTVLTFTDPQIWSHPSIEHILNHQDSFRYDQLTSPLYISILSTGPTLYAIAWCFTVIHRRGNSSRALLTSAYRRARNSIRKNQITHGIQSYITHYLGCDTQAFALSDIYQLPIQEELKLKIEHLFSNWDLIFDQHSTDRSSSTMISSKDAIQILQDLHAALMSSIDSSKAVA